ncbi:hypothetical protein F5884DRAFT_820181 [Xylogone sp. PMI_703]|nr:hypothetical protein F5884DRAFT_820181 [Xylogone sp. PMI_703]
MNFLNKARPPQHPQQYQRPQQYQQPPQQNYQQYVPPVTESIFDVGSDQKCTGAEPLLAKYTQFYVARDSATFSICSSCYNSRVAPNPHLSRQFISYMPTSDEDSQTCDLYWPRVLFTWQNECVPQGSLHPILNWVESATHYTACTGSTITKPTPYYTARNNAIPSLTICSTCFEVLLRKTPLEFYFEMNGGASGWTCDMAEPFLKRAVKSFLEDGNASFDDFAKEVRLRMSMPGCPGPGKPITEFSPDLPGIVFTAADQKGGNVCAACYSDHVVNTSLESSFLPARLTDQQLGTSPCDLSTLISQMAMELAARKVDFELWRNTVAYSGKLNACSGARGVAEEDLATEKEKLGDLANWYCLTACPTIEVCPCCYWCKIALFGATHLFSVINRPLARGVVRQCYFMPSGVPMGTSTDNKDDFETALAWRATRLFNSMNPGIQAGEWSLLFTVAASIATEPPPCGGANRGFTRSSGRRWFGRINPNAADVNDCTIVLCQECHSRAVKGTSYATQFSRDLTEEVYASVKNEGFICQTYTNRTRGLLREACMTGQFASFAQFWNHRAELQRKKDSWEPIIQAQLAKQRLATAQQTSQQMLKMNAMRAALAMQGSASVLEITSGDMGYRYGNSSIGYGFWSRSGADAEMAWRKASNMPVGMGAADPSLMADARRIFSLAKIDEDAFRAVE